MADRAPPDHPKAAASRSAESGNVIVFILIAIVLIGAVTAAIRSGGENANIDAEQMAIRVAEVRQHASEYERAVAFLIQNGVSEYDIRFAHAGLSSDYGNIATTPEHQVFAREGGGATYHPPAAGLQLVAGQWEFYGNTALPQAGSANPDLVAVLPNVTPAFCDLVNKGNNLDLPTPTDNAACVNTGAASRFDNGTQFPGTADNTMNVGTFSSLPATQGCVRCADNTLHFFHALLVR